MFTSTTRSKSFSQEFQVYNKTPGKLEYTLGLYYHDDDASQFIDWLAPGPFARADTSNRGKARAVFGQVTYNLSDQLAVLVGARYNHETKNGTQRNLLANTSANVSAEFDSFTPQGQIQFRPSSNVLAYIGVTKGFKSGGFNLLAAGPPTIYKPETIVAYEAGLKTSFDDGRVVINLAAFHYDYTNLQLRTLVFTGTGGGAFATTNNAEGAKIDGAELTANFRLVPGFTVDLSGTYLNARFGKYISPSNNLNLSGTRLPLSPKFSGTIGATYDGDISGGTRLRARVEYVYRSSIIFPLTLDAPQNFDDESGLVNASARLTLPGKKVYFEVLGRNLGDSLYRVQRADVFFSGVYDSFGAPRTFEARVGFNF